MDLLEIFLFLAAVAALAFLAGCLVCALAGPRCPKDADLCRWVRAKILRRPDLPMIEQQGKDTRKGFVTLYLPLDVWRSLELKMSPMPGGDKKPSKQQLAQALFWWGSQQSSEQQTMLFWNWCQGHALADDKVTTMNCPSPRRPHEEQLTDAVFATLTTSETK